MGIRGEKGKLGDRSFRGTFLLGFEKGLSTLFQLLVRLSLTLLLYGRDQHPFHWHRLWEARLIYQF